MNSKLWIKKNSPELLLTGGIIGFFAACGLTIFATLKSKNYIDDMKLKVNKIHERYDSGVYTEKEVKEKLQKTYVKGIGKTLLVCSPAAVALAASTACVVSSHNIQAGRNAALTAALATVTGSYNALREKIKEKYGEEVLNGIMEGPTEEKEVTTKKGEKKIVKQHVNKEGHDYSVFYGEGTTLRYDYENPGFNITELFQIESALNEKLHAKGYLFLEDVYKELELVSGYIGPEKMRAARYVGWLYDPNDPELRTHHVDFGFHDSENCLTSQARDFQAGLVDGIFLNFNHDGDILSRDYNNRCFTDTASSLKRK